jgi:adenosylcobinamide kinase/adenosylcobinamide-phosphate guanylyltransferase
MAISSSPQIILVTGPARSGKSELAEQLAANLAESAHKTVVYVATSHVDEGDREWLERIQKHQQRRPPHWQTIAEPINLSQVIRASQPDQCFLVDSLGTWLANVLDQSEEQWEATMADLINTLQNAASDVILVAEETGWGVVPAYPIGRQFRDRLGQLVRRIGAIAHPVYLVTGGHVLNLSQLGTPLEKF